MAETELLDIREYWLSKYPNVFISLWANEDKTKYFGKMMTGESSVDLHAESIGSLITVGEDFLRKVKR